MRIGVNLAYLRPQKVGGSEVYVHELVSELARMPELELVLFVFEDAAASFAKLDGVRILEIGPAYSDTRRLLFENSILARQAHRTGIDVLFSPANIAAPCLPSRIPQIVTIHDLQHKRMPRNLGWRRRIARHLLMLASVRRCSLAICISQYTQEDVQRFLRVPPAKTRVVHSGVTKLKPPSSERCRQVVKKYGLDSPFVYYPAMLAPHKNHETAVQAVRLLITQYDTQLSLVLTGDKPLGRKQVFEEYLEQLGMSGYVRHLGFVPREDVPCLMSLSKALVFPSRFEGFGLPILEAMQLGTPVLASRVGSIPEIAGGGAWLLDPDDPANWCEALVSVLRGGRKLRNRIAVGYEHVQGFSWEKCAVQTAAVFKEAMYTR